MARDIRDVQVPSLFSFQIYFLSFEFRAKYSKHSGLKDLLRKICVHLGFCTVVMARIENVSLIILRWVENVVGVACSEG